MAIRRIHNEGVESISVAAKGHATSSDQASLSFLPKHLWMDVRLPPPGERENVEPDRRKLDVRVTECEYVYKNMLLSTLDKAYFTSDEDYVDFLRKISSKKSKEFFVKVLFTIASDRWVQLPPHYGPTLAFIRIGLKVAKSYLINELGDEASMELVNVGLPYILNHLLLDEGEYVDNELVVKFNLMSLALWEFKKISNDLIGKSLSAIGALANDLNSLPAEVDGKYMADLYKVGSSILKSVGMAIIAGFIKVAVDVIVENNSLRMNPLAEEEIVEISNYFANVVSSLGALSKHEFKDYIRTADNANEEEDLVAKPEASGGAGGLDQTSATEHPTPEDGISPKPYEDEIDDLMTDSVVKENGFDPSDTEVRNGIKDMLSKMETSPRDPDLRNIVEDLDSEVKEETADDKVVSHYSSPRSSGGGGGGNGLDTALEVLGWGILAAAGGYLLYKGCSAAFGSETEDIYTWGDASDSIGISDIDLFY